MPPYLRRSHGNAPAGGTWDNWGPATPPPPHDWTQAAQGLPQGRPQGGFQGAPQGFSQGPSQGLSPQRTTEFRGRMRSPISKLGY